MDQVIENKKPSRREGFWFFFEVDNLKIAAQTTVWSKYKEIIYIDDEIYSEKRTLNGQGNHLIVLDGVQYQIVFKVTKFFSGELYCQLYRNGQLIESEKKAFYGKQNTSEVFRTVWKTIGITWLVSFVIAFTIATFY